MSSRVQCSHSYGACRAAERCRAAPHQGAFFHELTWQPGHRGGGDAAGMEVPLASPDAERNKFSNSEGNSEGDGIKIRGGLSLLFPLYP